MPHYLQDISAMDASILTAGMKECKEGGRTKAPRRVLGAFYL